MPKQNQEIANKIRRGYKAVVSSSTASDRACKVRELVNLVAKDNDDIGRMGFGRNQADAAEFLNPLLDNLYEKPPIILESNLLAKTKEGLTSPAPTKNTDVSISLTMDKSNKVSAFVSKYQEEEILRDSEDFKGFKDSKGNNQQDKTGKKTTIYIEENVAEISVSIVRFKMNDYGICVGKNNDEVELDDVQLLTKNGEKKTFKATSFIVHDGDLRGGHYTAYVKEKDNKWYLYNDSNRSEVGQKDLEEAKKKAYVVKYSTAGANGEIALPDKQCASENLGNTCWANAAAAFAGSFTSFEKEKNVANPNPPLQDHRRANVQPTIDFGPRDKEKHVRFSSQDDVQEFDKNAPVAMNQLYKTTILQPNKVQSEGNTLLKMQNLGLGINPRAIDTKGKQGSANLVTMGLDKSDAEEKLKNLGKKFKANELNLLKVKQSEIPFEILDEEENKKVLSNKFAKALNRLRETYKDSNDEEKTWKNLTTLDRRVLVYYYNQNHDVKIDFQSLYKESQANQKAELTIRSQGYVFDVKKIDDLKKVMSYAKKVMSCAAEETPKSSIKNPVAERLAEMPRAKGHKNSSNFHHQTILHL